MPSNTDEADMKTAEENPTWYDAIIAAKARARLNGRGVAYAIQWPPGHFSAEDNKPSLRSPDMRVLECDCTGGEHLA
jgi:hypothetical protein